VRRLHYKLILVFLAATLIPTAAIVWMNALLLDHSLSYVATEDLETLSKSLEETARGYYRQSCDILKREAVAGRIEARRWNPGEFTEAQAALKQFWESGEPERFEHSEPDGDLLLYIVRQDKDILVYSRPLGLKLAELEKQLQQTRSRLDVLQRYDLRKGFMLTLLILSSAVWILALATMFYMAKRISRPIQDLTAGLHRREAISTHGCIPTGRMKSDRLFRHSITRPGIFSRIAAVSST